ncbi:hypothetical protein [Geobacter sp. SVR]|uniref:hypothetical protein n=1 Tax=Geobacter sp. SVR TaxID=2495594 RepID=UPI00143F0514|nr:hypothetical protein [Geobacter sp. SVR]BCS51901.1 hypothetical protein GSVR_02090 [Geobacter sp. SVR]GCF87715.1 hypothetical protein GSbR_43150 [Geobacter sp. SVR]
MAAKANKNGNLSDTSDEVSTGEFPSCGPGCDCGSPTSKTSATAKIVICCVVVAIIAGILLFKAMNARQNPAAGFSASFARKGPVTNSSVQGGGSGAAISAIADLNDLAAKLDTVFLVIPSKDNAPASNETGDVLASVERTLNEKGLSTGIYTLKATSPDYPDVAAKVTPPGIAVLTKGRGIGFVSGGMSENKLMQAYVASTRGGGCGPSGCPPPGGGKAAVPCN